MNQTTWHRYPCGCMDRVNGERYEFRPHANACAIYVFAQQESARQGHPIRFEVQP